MYFCVSTEWKVSIESFVLTSTRNTWTVIDAMVIPLRIIILTMQGLLSCVYHIRNFWGTPEVLGYSSIRRIVPSDFLTEVSDPFSIPEFSITACDLFYVDWKLEAGLLMVTSVGYVHLFKVLTLGGGYRKHNACRYILGRGGGIVCGMD